MNARAASPGSLPLASALVEASRRHEIRHGTEVSGLIRAVDERFDGEWRGILADLSGDPSLGAALSSCGSVMARYCPALRWLGWDICHFGPPLGVAPADDYPLALIAYLSCRLMDDGIDGHSSHRRWLSKGRETSLYGHLSGRMERRKAAATSTLMGAWAFNAAVIRLQRAGFHESAGIVLEQFQEICPGVLAESLATGSALKDDAYREIVKRKSVAYNMILHRVFLRNAEPETRAALLELLGGLTELSQWLSDLLDERADRAQGQASILSVPGMNRRDAARRVVAELEKLWTRSRGLPGPCRDALASRMAYALRLAASEAARS